ncbi:hypothetical protein Nepgr_014728 [Nepenthes gracilis]|uniref:Uncharacterized protein n=1 Tax=Nepenthes gracilis TaxID=150966 RepID=A0AAD3SLT9_NEPGR|nr:hypothetical protein Nepgr_014728 [Nepenthes gracilis]
MWWVKFYLLLMAGFWFEFLDWTVVSLLDEFSRIGCALVCCGVSGLVNDDDGGSLRLEITLSCGAASAGLYYTMRVMSMRLLLILPDGSSAITVAAWVVKLANLISNDEVWTVLPMVSSTKCSKIWWLKTNCCSSAGYADGGDGPVCWASSTGDGWTTALVFEVADPSGGRSDHCLMMTSILLEGCNSARYLQSATLDAVAICSSSCGS